MPARRHRTSSRRARGRAGLLVGIVIVAVAIIVVWSVLHRQIQGYLTAPERSPKPAESVPGLVAPPVPTPTQVVATPVTGTGPKVAIIIDDCGYNVPRCLQFLDMPIPLTISILPLTPHARELEADALARGKFVMLHLPMQPDSTDYHPGPGAITTSMSDEQVQAQVEADIASVPGAPGANNHMGSKATSDPRVMKDVLEVFARQHLFFIDSMTSLTTVGEATAEQLGVPTAKRDVFLDDSKDLPYIEGQFAELQRVALKQGTAIAIGHPFDTTAEALAKAIPQMLAAGITFVPAQDLVKQESSASN
jgi:polysaccharide deacetylase 2 family uncharacterized protein YibQ